MFVIEIDGSYELVSVELDGKEIKLCGEKKMIFFFEWGKLNGKLFCNGYSVGYVLGENNILILLEFIKGCRICVGKMGKEDNLLSLFENVGFYELLGVMVLKVNLEKGNLVLWKLL